MDSAQLSRIVWRTCAVAVQLASSGRKLLQAVEFQSDDPVFAGETIMTWTLQAVAGGARVTIICENVPAGIRKEDHDVGLASTLDNLAAYTEGAGV